MRKKLLISLFSTILFLLGLSQSALADAPPTTPSLQGETLVGNPPTHRFQAHCNDDGTGYLSYQTAGLASGPYTGYFAEVGRQTFASVTNGKSSGTFQADFVIWSVTPPARINGTKSVRFTGVQLCQAFVPPAAPVAGFLDFAVPYSATITTEEATFHDAGISYVQAFAAPLPGFGYPNAFVENFTVSNYGLTLTATSGGDEGTRSHSNAQAPAGIPAPVATAG